MINKLIDHVGLNVSNLGVSINFYQEVFGFSLIESWDAPRQAFIGSESIVLGLIEIADYDFRSYTMAHIAFSCCKADFPAFVSKISKFGVEIVTGPKEQRGGETILFRDPSGNILEVCYPSIAEWQAKLI